MFLRPFDLRGLIQFLRTAMGHGYEARNMATSALGKRLKVEMQRLGINAIDVARHADVKPSFLYDVINGKSANPSSIKLARVADVLGVSLTYLASGRISDPFSQRPVGDPHAKEWAILPWLVAQPGTGEVTRVHAPQMAYAFAREGLRSLGAQEAQLCLAAVPDDGMLPTLRPHDVVMVDTSRCEPYPAGAFVLFDGLGLTIRRIEPLPGSQPPRVRLVADNPRVAPLEADAKALEIVGRIVWAATRW